MRQFTKGIDLYHHQLKRFAATQQTVHQMHSKLVASAVSDGKELTHAPGASGKARRALLRRLGHPFGRGTSASTSTATGKARGASAGLRKANGVKGQLPLLPIGLMTGRLKRSIGRRGIAQSKGIQRFDVGPINRPGPGIFRLRPQGTTKMVGSPYFNEVKRRWRPRNKALLDTVKARQRNF